MKTRRRRITIAIYVISIALLWLFLGLQYRYDRTQAVAAAETNVSNLSKAFEENILGTVRHLDEFLITLRRDYPQRQEQIATLIASYNRHSDKELIIQLSIIGPDGIMLYSSKGMPDKPLDLSDREHFRVHMNSSDDRLFISKPVKGRVSNKWSIQFTRKLLRQDGSFAGVAVLSVDPEYFSGFYRSIDIGSRGVITLLGSDGIIRARSAAASQGGNPIGISIPATDPLLDPKRPPVGIYRSVSSVDGVSRIASYRRLKSYPLIVRVAVADEEVFSVLSWHRLGMILQGCAATVALLIFLRLTLRFNDRQQRLTEELTERVFGAISELRQRDQMLISQGRQAAMGEMIGNIAHQWRQPLNALAILLGNIESAHMYNELTGEYIRKAVDNGNRIIQKMSTTIDDFRNFFRPDKETVIFSAQEQIRQALTLVHAGLTSQNITITLDAPCDYAVEGFPNEYSQVLLNLFINSRDAILSTESSGGAITIRLFARDDQVMVAVRDTGGGIPDDVIDKIFEPYFSTKSMGTGIGLYMSKTIIERSMNGSISARNVEGGAEFLIATPLKGEPHDNQQT